MHADSWWCERVIGRKDESAPILAAVIRSVLGTSDDVVPFKDVALRGVRGDVGRRVLRYGLELACQALVCGLASHIDDR